MSHILSNVALAENALARLKMAGAEIIEHGETANVVLPEGTELTQYVGIEPGGQMPGIPTLRQYRLPTGWSLVLRSRPGEPPMLDADVDRWVEWHRQRVQELSRTHGLSAWFLMDGRLRRPGRLPHQREEGGTWEPGAEAECEGGFGWGVLSDPFGLLVRGCGGTILVVEALAPIEPVWSTAGAGGYTKRVRALRVASRTDLQAAWDRCDGGDRMMKGAMATCRRGDEVHRALVAAGCDIADLAVHRIMPLSIIPFRRSRCASLCEEALCTVRRWVARKATEAEVRRAADIAGGALWADGDRPPLVDPFTTDEMYDPGPDPRCWGPLAVEKVARLAFKMESDPWIAFEAYKAGGKDLLAFMRECADIVRKHLPVCPVTGEVPVAPPSDPKPSSRPGTKRRS